MSCILRPFSRLDAKNSYPNWDIFIKLNDSRYGKWYPILDQNSLISIPFPRLNCSQTLSLLSGTYPYSLHGSTPPSRAMQTSQETVGLARWQDNTFRALTQYSPTHNQCVVSKIHFQMCKLRLGEWYKESLKESLKFWTSDRSMVPELCSPQDPLSDVLEFGRILTFSEQSEAAGSCWSIYRFIDTLNLSIQSNVYNYYKK